VQARSQTVAGAPYSYTIGAGDELAVALANPGIYDLSLHGPNGFFRHFAGSAATALRVEVHSDHDSGGLRLKLTAPGDRHGRGRDRPVIVNVADAYGRDRRIAVGRAAELTFDTRHAGGWYDIALTTQSDASFAYQLAGRLESAARLTSDPQLGRA
jgi:phospholipase C